MCKPPIENSRVRKGIWLKICQIKHDPLFTSSQGNKKSSLVEISLLQLGKKTSAHPHPCARTKCSNSFIKDPPLPHPLTHTLSHPGQSQVVTSALSSAPLV